MQGRLLMTMVLLYFLCNGTGRLRAYSKPYLAYVVLGRVKPGWNITTSSGQQERGRTDLLCGPHKPWPRHSIKCYLPRAFSTEFPCYTGSERTQSVI
ncbi:hypothetical protein DFH94DRAFT_308988 [Russula ochroleuca]|uniref:Secreted protein n=1 Tax=Russula ochroleuca TaxID=152965 RepID=A0A9P5N0U4_9AGAM|nr:hypothetical protein DFH94DRAFT_308988 [Russula ochroleuca]